MRKVLMMFVAMIAASLCSAGEGKKGKVEEKIPLDQLPAAVKSAAEGAVKGIVLTEAEKVTKKGEVTYEIDGKAGDKAYDIKVSSDGKVLKVKEEKDEDNDKDDEKDGGKKKGKGEKKSEQKAVPPPEAPKGEF